MVDNAEKLEALHASLEEHAEKPDHTDRVEAVLPISQEAVQDAYHVHLSWRSWVCILTQLSSHPHICLMLF
jgi:hypothetical protein